MNEKFHNNLKEKIKDVDGVGGVGVNLEVNYFIIANYYVYKKKIGIGSFATIYKGIEKDLGLEVAIKRIHVKDASDIKKISSRISKEINIMKELKHPNIVRMYDVIYEYDYDNVNIIMEYAPFGNLADLRKKKENGIIGEIYSKFYLRQIGNGLKYLLSKNIIHRDLKPHNILVFDNNILKIADFGFARNFNEDQLFTTFCGSPLYMAPEIIIPMVNKNKNENTYNIKADLWSIGVILYEMLTGNYPIMSKSLYHLPQQIKEFELKIPINIILTTNCRDILSNLLIKDPNKRIEWNAFFKHKWFETDEILEKQKSDLERENELIEIADKLMMNQSNHKNISLIQKSKLSPQSQQSPQQNIILNKNISKINKLGQLNFELSSSPKINNSYEIRPELTQLHNSFQELKKNYSSIQSHSQENKNDNDVNLCVDVDGDNELFMSCEEEEVKKEEVKTKELESKLDVIITQLNELKTIQNENLNLKARIRQLSGNMNDNYEIDLSFNKMLEESSGEDNISDNDNEDEKNYNQKNENNNKKDDFEKYVLIKSSPIKINNIQNEISSSDMTDNRARALTKDNFKYYINSSINILKESAAYLTNNYKSI